MLPSQLGKGKADSAFLKLFGDRSLEQAKALLKAAKDKEDDSEIKAEIERRLKLLEPKGVKPDKVQQVRKTISTQRKKKVQERFM